MRTRTEHEISCRCWHCWCFPFMTNVFSTICICAWWGREVKWARPTNSKRPHTYHIPLPTWPPVQLPFSPSPPHPSTAPPLSRSALQPERVKILDTLSSTAYSGVLILKQFPGDHPINYKLKMEVSSNQINTSLFYLQGPWVSVHLILAFFLITKTPLQFDSCQSPLQSIQVFILIWLYWTLTTKLKY